MPEISIQFHALPEELVAFLKECVSDFALHIVTIRPFPFQATVTAEAELNDVVSEKSNVQHLLFTLDNPEVLGRTINEIFDDNPDKLRLDIGRWTEKGFEQSWLCCRTDNFSAITTWKEIARRLKAITRTGVVAVNRTTGATAPAKSFRYTEGARALEESGVPMTEQDGGCLLRFIP